MAKFMEVHEGFVGVTQEQLQEAPGRDLVNEGAEGVHFERAWLDPGVGQGVLPVEGDGDAGARSGRPTTQVYEVPVEVA